MTQTYFSSEPDTEIRFQCRHIYVIGHRCGSPSLRGEEFCYYHHTTRPPVPKQELEVRKLYREVLCVPNTEDPAAIQHSLGDILRRIATNDIDPRRAGLLLYGLQIASMNMARSGYPQTGHLPGVEEVITDPTLGDLAPRLEFKVKEREMGPAELLLRELRSHNAGEQTTPRN